MPPTDTTPKLYVSVDGGGTKTVCHLQEMLDNGFQVIGRGRSGASNPNSVGVEDSVRAVIQAINAARQAAGLPASAQPARAAIAIAGTANEARREQLQDLLVDAKVAHECRVFPDIIPIVAAAKAEGPAAAVIAGTGSTAIVRNESGKYALAGGWGYLLGDEGSGYGVGRDAVRQTILELETGSACSSLAMQIIKQLEVTTVVDIKQKIYGIGNQRSLLASLAPLVLEQAQSGDAAAVGIVDDAVQHLTRTLLRAVDRVGSEPSKVHAAATGGMLTSGSMMNNRLFESLSNAGYASVRLFDNPLECVDCLLVDKEFYRPIQFLD